jgi:1,4-dihydroxy-2-naphthoate octaprenyltransferase
VLFACLFGIYPVLVGGTTILLIGSISLVCVYGYSLGKFSLSHTGLADFFVFLFFGPLASGTTGYLLFGYWNMPSILLGLVPGLLSVAILVANNLRDQTSDQDAGKKTLVVRFGSAFGRAEYALCLTFSIFSSLMLAYLLGPSYLFIFLALPCAIHAIRIFHSAQIPHDYIPLLPATAKILAAVCVLSSFGVAFL